MTQYGYTRSDLAEHSSDVRARYHSDGMACPFCSASPDDAWGFSEYAIVLPSLEPIAPGHALVAPRRHVSLFYELDVQEQRMLWTMVTAIREQISKGMKVEQFHIGFADFQDEPGHTHIHVVPRGPDEDFELPGGIEWVADSPCVGRSSGSPPELH